MNLAGLAGLGLGGFALPALGPLAGLGGTKNLLSNFARGGRSPFGSMSGLNQNMGAAAQLLGTNAANDQYQQALAALQGVGTPDLNAAGMYDLPPELQQLAEIENINNAYNTTDRVGEDVQKDILGRLQNLSVTGDTANAALDRQNFLNAENVRTKGIRDAILQREAQAGRGGSGAGLLDQLTSGQNSALVGNQNALQTAANLQNTRMNAMGQAGALGGQYTNQQFQRAAAQNAIDQYNNSNQLQRMYYNNDMANDSATRKWNTGNANKDLQRQISQQDYNNRIGKVSGQVAQQNMMGNNLNQGYSNAGNMYQSGNQYNQGLNFQRLQNDQANQWKMFDRAMALGQAGAGFAGAPGGAGAAGGASGQIQQREHGGPVSAGEPYLVGEAGEELLVNKNGMRPIGSQSEEIIMPDQDGFVIPNDEAKHVKDFMHILTGKKWGYNNANS